MSLFMHPVFVVFSVDIGEALILQLLVVGMWPVWLSIWLGNEISEFNVKGFQTL
jgi:hypothetical protein